VPSHRDYSSVPASTAFMNNNTTKRFRTLFLVVIAALTACREKPGSVTAGFYDDLGDGQYAKAKTKALPSVQQQVAVIAKDKDALFNGQRWKYAIGKEVINHDSAQVQVAVKLNDGSQVWQTVKLCQSAQSWKITEVINTKIIYADKALKARLYNQYGKQMLIAPLDIGYINPNRLSRYLGKYILVTGYICGFAEKNGLLKMTMSDENDKPLLTVLLSGHALQRAVTEHQGYKHIDSTMETPLGNTFTIVGLLKNKHGLHIETSNPQDIMIGPFLRPEKF
jgi:hypothetical protein